MKTGYEPIKLSVQERMKSIVSEDEEASMVEHVIQHSFRVG